MGSTINLVSHTKINHLLAFYRQMHLTNLNSYFWCLFCLSLIKLFYNYILRPGPNVHVGAIEKIHNIEIVQKI